MNTVKIRWLGNKKTRVVDLPVGLSSLWEKTGEVVCNPVGEFLADQAQKLLSLPGASTMFVPEEEYQAAHQVVTQVQKPLSDKTITRPTMSAATKEAQRERGRKLAAAMIAKKEAAKQAAAQAPTGV